MNALASELPRVAMAPDLLARLSATVRHRLPRKSFGYLLSQGDSPVASDFVVFEDNVRNSPAWKGRFEAYGRYFVEHDDAGFVATPEESWRVQQEIWARGAVQVGVFHSHLRHPANFSGIDYDMHMERFDDLWHLIISVRNPELPQLRTYAVSRNGVRELAHRRAVPDAAERVALPLDIRDARRSNAPMGGRATDAVVAAARACLALAPDGTPKCKDNEAICRCVGELLQAGDAGAFDEFVTWGFLRACEARWREFVAPGMQALTGGSFDMGCDSGGGTHFCGESPRREVIVSPFAIDRTPVTEGLYGLFDRSRTMGEANRPVTGVSWFDAMVFSMWMGCRLPSEAEWEFACGGGAQGEWTCADEKDLPRFAWYSENSNGAAHEVARLEPNAFGLHDCHGNVWEWCFDGYDEHYYLHAPATDPVCLASPLARRSCRGGSVHALAEMCRTRYRFSEPAGFAAGDLGFRVARSVTP